MEYYIDGMWVRESYFWNAVHGIATEREMYELFEGKTINLQGRKYLILKKNSECM